MSTNEQTIRGQRNAELRSVLDQLKTQNDRRADYVVPASAVEARNGRIHVASEDLVLDPTPTMIGTMAPKGRLDLPVRHMREWHAGSQDPAVALAQMHAFDAVVNAGLAQAQAAGKSYMLRTFRGDQDGGIGVGRAMLSDRFRIVDNFDVLLSMLGGLQSAGFGGDDGSPIEIQGCDLTENRMRVRIFSPAVNFIATEWLKGYRNPFGNSGYEQGEEPIVFAGFEVSNSETGGGAFTICPRIVVQICRNGYQLTKHVLREIHLGGKLEAGEIAWSAATQQTNLELVKSMTADAVGSFLSVEFLEERIAELTEGGRAEVPAVDAKDVVGQVAKSQRFSDSEAEGILGAFIGGGQLTAGGVGHAVTAHAQRVADPERAAELEGLALAATSEAAKLVTV